MKRSPGLIAGYGLAAALVAGVASQLPWSDITSAVGIEDRPVAAAAPAPAPPASPRTQMPGSEKTWTGGELSVEPWASSFDVVPVGLTPSGALVPPKSVEQLGWWSGGAAPGSGTGTVVLAVHRDSRTQGRGPFAALEELPAGALVVLDGHTYRLQRTETYEKASLPAGRIFTQYGPERLVIVTCGGDFSSGTGWDSNVVSYFSPVGAA